ncbi:MAG: winged helix-turn-helix domain-containing protein [Pyrinomonadaceae bacterium]
MPRRFFEFESFRVDVSERQLRCDGGLVPLTPKVFDMLVVLIENKGETVDKERLIREVWADTYVEEGSINRNISTLRRALGDDTNEQRLIKTLPKRGYRFTENVREIVEDASPVFQIKPQPAALTAVPGTARTKFLTRNRLLVLLAGLAGFGFAVAWTVGSIGMPAADLAGLTGHERKQLAKSGPRNSSAVEDFAKGRSLWRERSAEGLHRGILHLEAAVRKDENFALAYAALADAYAFDTARRTSAREQAETAIRLDPSIGEPLATIGFVEMFWDWKLNEASKSFRKAIELSPDYATAHQWYALNLAASRFGGPALSEMKRAAELEPDSLAISADLCQIYYFLQKHDDAIEQCDKTLAIDPSFLNAHIYLYDIYTARGMHQDAVTKFFEIEKLKSDFSIPHKDLEKLREAYSNDGIEGFWRARIDFLESRPHFYRLAQYWARLGDGEKALDALETSQAAREFEFVYFKTDPAFNMMYTHSRFVDLGRKFDGS